MQTFVYDGKEVYLTGRRAVKESRTGEKILYEIRQIKYMNDITNSDVTSDWVSQTDLYLIVNEVNKNET